MAKFTEIPILTKRYSDALAFFFDAHLHQTRKDGSPYWAHLQAVSSLVLECEGSEDEAIAALAHDYPEDIHSDNPDLGISIVSDLFGENVAEIVKACTEPSKILDWKERKLSYVKQIANGSDSAVRVSLCDKYHNALAYLRGAELKLSDDSQKNGERTIWFYRQMLSMYNLRLPDHYLVGKLKTKIDKLELTWR